MNKRNLPHIEVEEISVPCGENQTSRYTLSGGEERKFDLDYVVVRRPSDVLVVSLHGGVTLSKDRLPRFEWLRTLHSSSMNQLYISDPTLTLHDHLINGWYIGNDEEDLTPRLAELVTGVAAKVGAKIVVLFGSSAGGFAAARIGSLIENSVALAFSTQRNLERGPIAHVSGLFQYVFPDDTGYACVYERMGKRISLEDTVNYEAGGQKFVWVQNSGDMEHMRDHFGPYREKIGEAGGPTSVKLIQKYYGPGHPIPPISLVHESIKACIDYAQTGVFSGIGWTDQAPRPTMSSLESEAIETPNLIEPGDGSQHSAGYVQFRGTATPGDVITMKIGEKAYQSVYADSTGHWSIDQSFAAGASWSVSIAAYRGDIGKSHNRQLRIRVSAN